MYPDSLTSLPVCTPAVWICCVEPSTSTQKTTVVGSMKHLRLVDNQFQSLAVHIINSSPVVSVCICTCVLAYVRACVRACCTYIGGGGGDDDDDKYLCTALINIIYSKTL